MTAVLLALAAMLAYGVPATLMLEPRARGPRLAGLGFLYGSGIVFLAMLITSICGAGWTLPLIATVAFLIAALFRVLAVRGARDVRAVLRAPRSPYALVVHLLTAAFLVAYTRYATAAPLWDWDFWAIWGLKARVFLEYGGIDWHFLESGWNTFAHADYPLLMPLDFDFIALVAGHWDDRWLGLLNVAFALALLLIVYPLARRETTPLIASIATLACVSTAASRYVGMAEGALIAFAGAGVLMVRAAIAGDDAVAMRHAALLLGFAASCKNEGLALLVAVAIALGLVARKWLPRLWPALLIVTPWLLLRAAHKLPTDLATGSMTSRLFDHVQHLGAIITDLALTLVNPVLWIALLAGVALMPAASRRREQFVLLVVLIQMSFYLATYLITPNEVHWHIATSWTRLTRHVLVPLIVVVVLALANWLGGGEDAPHAEARSEL
jgi:hypothetical protein